MRIHIVTKGDTMWKIAQKYGIDLNQLIASNPQIADPDRLNIGDKVYVPTEKGTQTKKSTMPKEKLTQPVTSPEAKSHVPGTGLPEKLKDQLSEKLGEIPGKLKGQFSEKLEELPEKLKSQLQEMPKHEIPQMPMGQMPQMYQMPMQQMPMPQPQMPPMYQMPMQQMPPMYQMPMPHYQSIMPPFMEETEEDGVIVCVAPGETLWMIASKYHIAIHELMMANPHVADPDDLEPGIEVKIPTPYGYAQSFAAAGVSSGAAPTMYPQYPYPMENAYGYPMPQHAMPPMPMPPMPMYPHQAAYAEAFQPKHSCCCPPHGMHHPMAPHFYPHGPSMHHPQAKAFAYVERGNNPDWVRNNDGSEEDEQ